MSGQSDLASPCTSFLTCKLGNHGTCLTELSGEVEILE